ncbi:mismatch repair endonuclease PMS2 [Topomyia yanbarensis]|uniref:mismatch repair endonuclease PMS2 n=1 Tax=Topomyia yanbarensis TaxID=2498891 RepID=UPI00273CD861|nr:mismatch repair endonuclease PMS2 [Topomyia yanbarensis]
MIEIEDIIEPTPTSTESKKISAIDKDTVHKICSGQVVLNLAIAVKELVENSIDAGATLIEVKLKEHGADLVEVADNGSGVEEKNFEGMTAKYHTSKLKEFSDLSSIETFGFRGEALSSLCALSNMVIVTRHELAPHGTKLELDHRGVIRKRNPCARAVGTTVSLSNLFATLPVRKKEFLKNIKKEFIKMCQILQAYCLVSAGVRIICTNQNKTGGKTVIMSTQGTGSVLDNISTVFGAKQATELVQLKPAISSSGKIMDLNESDFDDSLALTQEEVDGLNLSRYAIEGYISNCTHGSGRSSKDRQFFYINSRPCEPKQIVKLVNEIYHRYNVNQSPFVFINLKMDRSDVDVNLTPDKRQLLVNNEKILLLALKKSLLKTFGNTPSTFKMQNLDVSETSRLLNISVKSLTETEDAKDESLTIPNPHGFLEAFSQWKATGVTVDECLPKKASAKRKRQMASKLQKIHHFMNVTPTEVPLKQEMSYQSESESEGEDFEKLPKIARNSTMIEDEHGTSRNNISDVIKGNYQIKISESPESKSLASVGPPNSDKNVELIQCRNKSPVEDVPVVKFEKISPESMANGAIEIVPSLNAAGNTKSHGSDTSLVDRISLQHESSSTKVKIDSVVIEQTRSEADQTISLSSKRTINIDLSSLQDLIKQEHELAVRETTTRRTSLSRLKFKSKINPSSNRAAEDELQTEISQHDFVRMEIIAQFNLGFIVVRLDQDLFIIDQHATDEKYNFEDLQRNTVLQSQKLVVPQPLELTAVNEMILMDNLEIFEMNGFQFEIDGGAEPTRKIKLLAKPFSKNWEFGKEDIDELIFMLQDAPNTVCRPSRVRNMFASRACRKSVMIGKALSSTEMRKLVNHMGEIEQPWNCPHGRPTMRHLVNLSMIAQTEAIVEDED